MIKRSIDIVLSVVGLFLLVPVILVVAGLVRYHLGSPVIFVQFRPGLHGKLFKIFKFRTMHEIRAEDGELLSDRQRLSAFGARLRNASIDELPTLWNVLIGNMSLVGPRPLLKEYLPLYSDEQSRRHDVRPGITGWAQVNGRNSLSWDEKFNLDVWYVDNQSVRLDLKILFKTIFRVMKKSDIAHEGQVTMEKFRGNTL